MNEFLEKFNIVLDIGKQPISNRYLVDREQQQDFFPITLGQCVHSGLLKLTQNVPATELVPKFDWLTYAEPEPHLDDLVSRLMSLDDIDTNSVIAGVSFKDDSTLMRFEKLGFKTWRIKENVDLAIGQQGVGVESIQAALTAKKAKEIAQRYGKADVVFARHILEHAYDLKDFSFALQALIKPGGYVVIELPDCSNSIKRKDYTMLWEEHLYYFTPETFKFSLKQLGFAVEVFVNYPYPMENSLVAVVKPAKANLQLKENSALNERLNSEVALASEFGRSFQLVKKQIQQKFKQLVEKHGQVAFLGAGHLACTYIWLFELTPYISFIVDDNKHKQGLFMAGSALPIVGSNELYQRQVKACLLSVNPLSEQAVTNNNQLFIEQGGQFLSIFPNSDIHLLGAD